MAWVSYFGPANWTIEGADAAWDGEELQFAESGSVDLLPVAGRLPIRAEKWRLTVSSTDSSGTVVAFFYQEGDGLWNHSFSAAFPGTDADEFDVSGHLEGMERLLVGSTNSVIRVLDLEYDDETVRAESDILSEYLFDTPTGITWDFSQRGVVIADGTNHRLDFRDSFDWYSRWWDDWSAPPNQVRIKMIANAPLSCWLRIESGVFPDPSETVVWAPISLNAGPNDLVLPLNDVRYPWRRLSFADAGDFPYGTVSSPGVTLLELHAETVVIPPDPEELLTEIPPVTRFRLTLEDGGVSVDLPMTSFSSRLVSARPSYLQVVVPNADKYIDQITPLAAGEFFVSWELFNQATGELVETQEIARANVADITQARGPRSSSITITGNKQKTYANPVNHEIDVNHLTNGDQTRLGFDPTIRPADSLNGAEIDSVQVIASATDAYMTITTL